MDNLLQDLRYAMRTLLRAPGFSAIVIISIALGFAANATVFSVANGLLWGLLPVKDPGRVVMFAEGQSYSYPDYLDYRDQSGDLFDQGIAGHFPLIPASIGGKGEPERVWGQSVTGNFFPSLGVPMTRGRSIGPEDDQAGGRNHVVVLSNNLWRRRFGGDANVLNHDVALNGRYYTVVGIAPAGFYGVDRGIVSEFWVPLAVASEIMPDLITDGSITTRRDNQWLMMNGRLKPGITRKQAEVKLNVIKKRLDDTYRKDEKRHDTLTLQTAGGLIAGSATPAFTLMAVLMVVVGLVLLVACANVANLLLARAIGRQKEIAIRLAMGAKRRQLIRQLLFESFLLALTGAGVGFLLAAGAARAISNFQLPLPFPVVFDFNVDWRVALFTLGLSIITALAFGLVPALRASRPDLVGALKDGQSLFGGTGRSRLRNTLVVVQVALSLVLLATAGLFLRSLGNASSIDIGFKTDNVLIMTMDPKLQSYSHDKTVQFLTQVRDRVSALPGVRSVSFVGVVPLSIGSSNNGYEVDAVKDHPKQNVNADTNGVGSGYFKTMEIPLLRGRDFAPSTDDQHSVIINETMASHLFPGQDPIGRVIHQDKDQYTVIGITRNSKLRTIGEKPLDAIFMYSQCCSRKSEQLLRNHTHRQDLRESRSNGSVRTPADCRARSQHGRLQYRNDAATRRQIAAPPTHFRSSAGDIRRGRPYPRSHRTLRRHELFRSEPYARNRHPHGAWRKAAQGAQDDSAPGPDPHRDWPGHWTRHCLGRRTIRLQRALRHKRIGSADVCGRLGRPVGHGRNRHLDSRASSRAR